MSTFNAPYFHDEAAAFAELESLLWPHGPVCPRCNGMDRITTVKGGRMGLRRCGPCKRQFTVTVGTVFESSHVPLHQWLQVVYMMCSSKKGVSSHQVMRTLDVQYKTAWFMTHRIREAMAGGKLPQIGGSGKVVEADETYIGRKEGTTKKRGHGHKRTVVALVERGGEVRTFHVQNANAATVTSLLRTNADRASRLMTDESGIYMAVGTEYAGHESVNHSEKEYVRGETHTNTVEGYFGLFKRGFQGIYQHCAEKHLHRYLSEYEFRYNSRVRLGFDDMERTRNALCQIEGKRLTYRRIDADR
jgi:transposase-like protein